MGFFNKPFLAPGCAVFADFFGLACMVPTLPIFLVAWASSQGLVGDDGVVWARRWVGLILTAQSFAKMPGHLFWGVQSAKLGSRAAMAIVMSLNAIMFAASAFFAVSGLPLDAVAALLAVRLLAGFFVPTVPAFCFLFDRQEPGPALVASIGKFGGFILSGLTLGGAVVAVPFGEPFAVWGGVTGLSTGIALLALVPVFYAPPVLEDVVAMRKQKPEGIRRALVTNEFISHGLTSLASGWTVPIQTALPAVHYALYFEFSVPLIAVCATAASILTFFTAVYVVPKLVARYSISRSIYVGHVWQVVACVCLSLPWINRHPVAFPVMVGALTPGLCLAVNPNQNRASTIGRMHTTNGTGALTGVSRVLFSLGECLAPIVCINLLYPIGSVDPTSARIGTMLPYMLTAVVHILVLLAYVALRISPHTDPSPAVKPPAKATATAKVSSASA